MEQLKAELRDIIKDLQGPDLAAIQRGEERFDTFMRTHRMIIMSMLKFMLLDGDSHDVSVN